jgi:hypothetical protein
MDFMVLGPTRWHRPGPYPPDGPVRPERRRGQTMRSGSPYLKALASPGALRFSAAGILGRIPISASASAPCTAQILSYVV